MGIESLFVVNNVTESLIAVKHWGPSTQSDICERVFEAHRASVKASSDAAAVCVTGDVWILFNSRRGDVRGDVRARNVAVDGD